MDSWLYDPSVIGRWEHTPTVVPILERIEIIERDQGDFVEATAVQPEDLLPEVADYEVGPGDALVVEIWDFVQPGTPSQFQLVVDPRGAIDIPQLGRINVLGLTQDEIRERIHVALREAGIIEDALVGVTLAQQRQQTFAVFGAVAGVGRYFIPAPDYRLLEALTEAGGVPPIVRKVYVIRQTPLTDEAERGQGVRPAPKPDMPGRQQQPGEAPGRDLEQLIEELTRPEGEGQGQGGQGGNPAVVSPSEFSSGNDSSALALALEQSAEQQPPRVVQPPIDLPDEPSAPRTPEREEERPGSVSGTAGGEAGRWMFLNGEWVRYTRRAADAGAGLPEGEDLLSNRLRASDLVTQRVIEVPTEPLLQGVAEYNIVIRPGDVIRVPFPEQGEFYMGGPGIARPGTYSLPGSGRITMQQAVIAAGGLNGIGVPWRVDLTRRIGDNRQATIRLNVKAIFEGGQPDIFLKPDDVVNVGTSFWATPLAVIRNGFRMTYGFGFLLDRNFGNDVFGAPPTRIVGQ